MNSAQVCSDPLSTIVEDRSLYSSRSISILTLIRMILTYHRRPLHRAWVGMRTMLGHRRISVSLLLRVGSSALASAGSVAELNDRTFSALLDDPWSTETNGRNSATTTGIDPWQSSSAAQVNPWNETNHGAASNGTGLSVNVADPWGAGTNGTRTGKPSVDNELSEFFGASASRTHY